MPRVGWKSVSAVELVEASESQSLHELLPPAPAVYLFRRRISAPPTASSSAAICNRWIRDLTETATARLEKKQLSHCAWLDGFQVGGGGLTIEKLNVLDACLAVPSKRHLLVDYVETLSQFMPPLYVGQTVNLRVRVLSHLRRETGLDRYVREVLGLDWQDIDFRYLVMSQSAELSNEARALLELLEMIAQRIVAPFGTERPG
jgi:hypothetical protein